MSDPLSLNTIYSRLWQAFSSHPAPEVEFTQTGALRSCFAVTDFAAASIAVAGGQLAQLSASPSPIRVDRRLASYWFNHSLYPVNRPPQSLWDPLAGDYPTQEGWIRLHTNAVHHRRAMARVLGEHDSRDSLASAVSQWQAEALEQAVVEAGGCAAAMRSARQWQAHPQGAAVSQEPLLIETALPSGTPVDWRLSRSRPLLGIRVLDLTRIIAGPVATRLLAGLGAQVLRIDPPDWHEPTLEEEITLGKRCARLNIKTAIDKQCLIDLLSQADVIVHGYRADALDALGLDSETRVRLKPGLIDVSLNAWGWSGPWRNRRGFDSLVQMACGIAAAGQQWRQADKPVPLPVQALDHATGYLMAAAVLKGLYRRATCGEGYRARLSLARVAACLMQYPTPENPLPLREPQRGDFQPALEWSAFGLGERLRFPLQLAGTPVVWSRPSSPLGTAAASW
ncbi:TPA: acyl-CoA transferase [Raoultella planticola]|uniref:CoA transferase n=1 Tax=Raoultella planticola TaxID=575 RepID=UPI001A2A2C55|nr:acyl-CoA transferase [Raoultella planticola]